MINWSNNLLTHLDVVSEGIVKHDCHKLLLENTFLRMHEIIWYFEENTLNIEAKSGFLGQN